MIMKFFAFFTNFGIYHLSNHPAGFAVYSICDLWHV